MGKERQEPVSFAHVASQVDVVFKGKRARLVEQLDTALAEAGRHISVRRGLKAEFTLKVKCVRKGDEIKVACTLTANDTNPEPRALTLFADKYGLLVADDPTQIDLPLEEVQPMKETKS